MYWLHDLNPETPVLALSISLLSLRLWMTTILLHIGPQLLLLLLPMAAFLVVLADPQRAPEPVILLNLRLGELMNLVHLQPFAARATTLFALPY